MENGFEDLLKLLEAYIGSDWWVVLIKVGLVIGLAIAALLFTRHVVIKGLMRLIRNSKNNYDDIIAKFINLRGIAYIPSIVIIYYYANTLPESFRLLQDLCFIAISLIILRLISGLLDALNEFYMVATQAKYKPIKGYIQLLQLFIYIIGAIFIVGTLTQQDPVTLITSIGAFTAVILLIFRDTILSLVASVQISTNDLVNVGDWVEMQQFGADGEVIDIALHTIQIQNWDKTITTVPTYKFIEVSFKNWRGMTAAGGRRIKRSIMIDMNTIRPLKADEIEVMKGHPLLKGYIQEKLDELAKYNALPENQNPIRQRRLTNIGTYRKYLNYYLEHHPSIRQDMTLMVRQLPPTTTGLPLELYCFTNTTVWLDYETIQADIFDHIMAVTPLFGLRFYQMLSRIDNGDMA